MEKTKDIQNIITLITECHNKTITFDIEIASDRLKYSSWIAVLASAVIGFIITKGNEVMAASILTFYEKQWSLTLIFISLFISIVFSALIYYRTNRLLQLWRLRRTNYLAQEIILARSNEISFPNEMKETKTDNEDANKIISNLNLYFNIDSLIDRIHKGQFLSDENLAAFEKQIKDILAIEKELKLLLILQIVFVALAYLILLVTAAPFITIKP